MNRKAITCEPVFRSNKHFWKVLPFCLLLGYVIASNPFSPKKVANKGFTPSTAQDDSDFQALGLLDNRCQDVKHPVFRQVHEKALLFREPFTNWTLIIGGGRLSRVNLD
jgi:hypothetical protein